MALTPEQEAFQQELELRTAEHQNITAAEQRASFQDTAEYLRERINADDPQSLYYRKPREAAEAIAQIDAVYIKSGIARPGAPDPKQLAAPAPVTASTTALEPELQTLVDRETARLTADKHLVERSTAETKELLGPTRYNDLVARARQFKGNLTPAELASKPVLEIYAARARFAGQVHGRK